MKIYILVLLYCVVNNLNIKFQSFSLLTKRLNANVFINSTTITLILLIGFSNTYIKTYWKHHTNNTILLISLELQRDYVYSKTEKYVLTLIINNILL